jgi:uncharacterized protein YjbI with pentapeptide repeats
MLGLNFHDCKDFLLSFRFSDCQLNLSSFQKLKLKRISFIRCNLEEVDFTEADLSGAIFDECNLHRAIFQDTNLTKADFYSAFDYSIDPEANRMKKAIFSRQGVLGLLNKYDLTIK